VNRTPCGFCGSQTNKITKEHLFARWLTPVLATGKSPVIRHDIRFGEESQAAWETPALNAEARMACRPCNSGWMSDLKLQ